MQAMPSTSLDTQSAGLLLDVARASIEHGVDHGRPLAVQAVDFLDAGEVVVVEHQAGGLSRLCGCRQQG